MGCSGTKPAIKDESIKNKSAEKVILMPNLIGTKYYDAENSLKKLGFEVTTIMVKVETTLTSEELDQINYDIDGGNVFKINDVIDPKLKDSEENPFAPDGKVNLNVADENYHQKKEQSTSATPKPQQSTSATPKPQQSTSNNIEWKEFLEDYEKWVDSYIAIMKKYKKNPSDTSILSEYTEAMSDLITWSQKADKVQVDLEDDPSALEEYMKTYSRIIKKLNEV